MKMRVPHIRFTSASETTLAYAWLGFLVLSGVITLIQVPLSSPRPPGAIVDTVYASGDHLIFVVMASGNPSEEYVQAVEKARERFHEFADSSGFHFSTVGVAIQMQVKGALWVLDRYGTFDEVDVGRGWFNSGVKRFAEEMAASTNLPQVLAVLETIEVRSHGWESLRQIELARFIGPQELERWEGMGSPINLEHGRQLLDRENP